MATPIKENTTALEDLLDRARALPSVPGSVEQATPTIAVSSGGLITASATQGAGVVSAGTKSATKQLPTKGATTIEPSDEVQTAVSAGTYVTGDIKVAAQSGGVEIRRYEGNFTTIDDFAGTPVNCGFQPDVILIKWPDYNENGLHVLIQACCCFIDNPDEINAIFAGTDSFQNTNMYIFQLIRNQTGFNVYPFLLNKDYSLTPAYGTTFQFVAYKYE